MSDIDPQRAVDFLRDTAPRYAKAMAERIYLEEFRKSKKAILMGGHKDKPIGAQEREAYADPEYIGVLDAIRVAVEAEQTMRWQMIAAQARLDIWRSQEASNRRIDRATQ